MTRIFRCARCSSYLGEMEKGRIKKTAVLLCESCNCRYVIAESIANTKTGNPENINYDIPDFMMEFLKKGE